MKKLIVFVGLFMAINLIWPDMPTVQAENPSTFLKASGGASATSVNWEDGKITGIFQAEALRLVYWNVAVGYQWEHFGNEGAELNEHAAHIYIYSRNPKTKSEFISPYLVFGLGGTHGIPTSDNQVDFTWDGALGILFPNWTWLKETNLFIEAGYKYVEGASIFGLSAGIHSGLDF
jgi:hypothetical protein